MQAIQSKLPFLIIIPSSLSKSTSASDRTGGKSLVPHLARIFMHLLLVVIPMIFNVYVRYLGPKFNSPLYDLWIDCGRSQFQAGVDPLPLCRSIASAVDVRHIYLYLSLQQLFNFGTFVPFYSVVTSCSMECVCDCFVLGIPGFLSFHGSIHDSL